MDVTEGMIKRLFQALRGIELADFPVLTWEEAMRRYGSDKPDLRNPLQLVDMADLMAAVPFKVFSGPANDLQGRVVALKAPGGGQLTRRAIDALTAFVGRYGAKGLAYIKVNDLAQGMAGCSRPSSSFCRRRWCRAHSAGLPPRMGDLVFFGAGKAAVVNLSMGALRDELGPCTRLGGGRIRTPLGGGLATVRDGRKRRPDTNAPSVHPAQMRPQGVADRTLGGQGLRL